MKFFFTLLLVCIAESILAQRTDNLGVSGPTMSAIGGAGPNFLRHNSSTDAGSAVREGLMPPVRPFVDAQVRDAVVCRGHDGQYYMTGSTGDDIWRMNDGVEVWVSGDLRQWDYLGLVWSFERDATWQRVWRDHRGPVRALWAPELHYVKGNYFITISMPPGDRGLLRSTTGKPEGPYVNALADDGKWEGGIDASLFEDEDGTVYVVWDGGNIARMKGDMSGMAEAPRKIALLSPDTISAHHAPSCSAKRQCSDIGHEGASLFKHGGLYYYTAADTYEGRYSSIAAVSDNVYGPYRMRHEAVPCGGGTGYFCEPAHTDENGVEVAGRWWCTMFGNDAQAPFREMPAMICVEFTESGRIRPARQQPMLNAAEQIKWGMKWDKTWKNQK